MVKKYITLAFDAKYLEPVLSEFIKATASRKMVRLSSWGEEDEQRNPTALCPAIKLLSNHALRCLYTFRSPEIGPTANIWRFLQVKTTHKLQNNNFKQCHTTRTNVNIYEVSYDTV
jgi:hypothetical protein